MKKSFVVAVMLALVLTIPLTLQIESQTRYRTPVKIPDIPGYRTLKCDFHIHTVFSDGSVWPDVRPEEAWREGLDAIAITDHIEYQPHKDDLPTRHNRSFEIAKPHGDTLSLTVIKGSEVTRDMPPGHLNAIFLSDSVPLETEQWRDVLKIAGEQGAFIFWNHPGWSGQQPDRVPRWYPEHTELVENGLLHGIEVANEREYYPEAQRWCMEKKLTMLSNSDIHAPVNLDYHVHSGDHRPMTLVFATDSSGEAIKEALFARRTAVYTGHLLVGEEKYLQPIFGASVEVLNSSVTVRGTGRAYVQIQNHSEIDYELRRTSEPVEFELPEELTLLAGRTVLLEIKGNAKEREGRGRFNLRFIVENLKIEPGVGMPVQFEVDVAFVPDPAQ